MVIQINRKVGENCTVKRNYRALVPKAANYQCYRDFRKKIVHLKDERGPYDNFTTVRSQRMWQLVVRILSSVTDTPPTPRLTMPFLFMSLVPDIQETTKFPAS